MGVLAVRAHEVFLGAPPHLARSLAGKTPRFLAEVEDSNPVNTAAAISGSVSPLIAVSACHRACIHQVALGHRQGRIKRCRPRLKHSLHLLKIGLWNF